MSFIYTSPLFFFRSLSLPLHLSVIALRLPVKCQRLHNCKLYIFHKISGSVSLWECKCLIMWAGWGEPANEQTASQKCHQRAAGTFLGRHVPSSESVLPAAAPSFPCRSKATQKTQILLSEEFPPKNWWPKKRKATGPAGHLWQLEISVTSDVKIHLPFCCAGVRTI